MLAGRWLAYAESDLAVAYGVDRPGVILETLCFHAQQATEKAIKAGITEVAFDRSGFRYHGRVKALAEAAREAGLKF